MSGSGEDDEALWAGFTKGMQQLPRPPALPDGDRGQGKSRRGRKPEPEPEKLLRLESRNAASSAAAGAAYPSFSSSSDPQTAAQVESLPGTDLDRRTEERLVSGRMPIDGRIDLHGMTQAQAQRALTFFIAESLERGRRTLLVITGKGRGGALASETAPEDWIAPRPGVLRQNMPRWLEAPEIRPHILKIIPAQPRHGGSGAFYIYLRRAR